MTTNAARPPDRLGVAYLLEYVIDPAIPTVLATSSTMLATSGAGS